jgi:hypothetical protein
MFISTVLWGPLLLWAPDALLEKRAPYSQLADDCNVLI